jgi:hypothetical protein
MKSCAHCGSTKFGLVRYRLGTLQFCKKVCKEAWQSRFRRYVRSQRRWTAYLARGPYNRLAARLLIMAPA